MAARYPLSLHPLSAVLPQGSAQGGRNTTRVAVFERRKRKTCAGLESNPRPLAHAPAPDAFAVARGARSTRSHCTFSRSCRHHRLFFCSTFPKSHAFFGSSQRGREAERERAKRRVSWARWRRNSRRRRRHVMRLRSLKCGGTLAPTCSYLSTPAGRRSSTSRGSTSTQTQHSCFEQHKGLTFSKCGAAETPHTRPTQAIASALTPKFYSNSTLNFSILFLEHQPNNLFLVFWKQPLSRLKGVSTRGTCMSCASTKTTRRG